MKRILITGASGFIGRQAVELLRDADDEIHAVSTHFHDNDGVHWHQADLLDATERTTLVKVVQPTHVLHFAWIATPGIYWTSPLNKEWHAATLDLCTLAKHYGAVRFIGAGTCAEYDWTDGHCDEVSTPIRPATPYGMAKADCAKAILEELEISTAWGRIFLLYGPHEHPKRLVSSVILSLLRKERAKCSHGMQIRDFLHVHDVARAFVALLDSDVTGAVNIASGEPVSIRTVVQTIAHQMHTEDLIDFGAIPAPENDPPRLTASTNRLMNEAGFQPAFSLESGLADTIEWWKASTYDITDH